MRNKILTLVVVFSLLCSLGTLMAKERRGAELVVQKKDGRQIRGELIAVKQASLLLLDSQSGADVSVYTNDVNVIKIMKESKTLLGASLGLLIGGAVGTIIGYGSERIFWHEGENWAPKGAVIGSLAGGAIGAMIASKPKTIQIDGKSPEEIRKALQELHSQARITNFQ
jgi:hypothetical protein